jgi:hypothetical protein
VTVNHLRVRREADAIAAARKAAEPPVSLEEHLAREDRRRTLAKRAAAREGQDRPDAQGGPETSVQRLTREWNQRAAADREQEALRAEVMFQHPDAVPEEVLADPLRAFARGQRARRRKRRGRIP